MLSKKQQNLNENNYEAVFEGVSDQDAGTLRDALGAVLRVHRPDEYGGCNGCEAPDGGLAWCWPCETVDVIAAELGVRLETLV